MASQDIPHTWNTYLQLIGFQIVARYADLGICTKHKLVSIYLKSDQIPDGGKTFTITLAISYYGIAWFVSGGPIELGAENYEDKLTSTFEGNAHESRNP